MSSAVPASPKRWRSSQRRVDLSDRRDRLLVLQAARERTVASVSRGLAHQLRNPLQAIVLASRAIAKGTNGQSSPRLADVVERETERLNGLLNRLNQLHAPASVSLGPVSLPRLFDEACALSIHCSFGGEATVECSLPPDLPLVNANPADLLLAVLAVVVNAKEALAPDSGTVRVRAMSEAPGALVVVEDDGPGIASHDLERVFEPFYTTKESAGALGLGLTAARLMLEETGGHVWAEVPEKARGGGARFVLSIPWSRPEPAA